MISVFLLAFSCIYDPPTASVKILNYSDSAIYVLENCECKITRYPVLKLFEKRTHKSVDEKGEPMPDIYSPAYRINPYQVGEIGYFGSKKDKKIQCANGFVCFFFIKESTIKNYTWDEIVKKQLYAQKMRFNKSQLDSVYWKIRYSSSASVSSADGDLSEYSINENGLLVNSLCGWRLVHFNR